MPGTRRPPTTTSACAPPRRSCGSCAASGRASRPMRFLWPTSQPSRARSPMPTFTAEALRHATQVLLEATGTPPDLAQIVAEALVEANLAGHDSHGLLRLTQYIDLVRQGHVLPAARASLLSTRQATARVDGARGWGPPAARPATPTAIDLAHAHRGGVGTIQGCN